MLPQYRKKLYYERRRWRKFYDLRAFKTWIAIISNENEFLSIEIEDLLALIKRDDLKVKEERLCEACSGLIKGDMENKKIFFEKIFECIRFPLMYLNIWLIKWQQMRA